MKGSTKEFLAQAIVWILAGSLITALVLGIYWVFWQLWLYVMSQLWAGGPENIVRPGYLLFVCCIMVVSFIGKLLFGYRGSEK